MACMNTRNVVESLFRSLNLPQDLVKDHLRLTGEPRSTLPSSFNLGIAAQASIAASGLSVALLHSLWTGKKQDVTVDARHAALEFRKYSEAYYTINGAAPGDAWDALAGTYLTRDRSFVRIHTNFPHHRDGILSILGLSSTASREAVSRALSLWDAEDFEAEAARRGMCATAMRSFEEWDKHPHARAIRDVSPVLLIKIGEAPKRLPYERVYGQGPAGGALEGIRVLDLTRVLAGPICGRTLAAHGADVLLITSPLLPSLPSIDADTSRGKRTTQLDLTTAADREKLWSLVRDSDVFLQGYRPGGLAEKGFSVTELAAARPGIICANITAWGWDGPWKENRGFDSLVQTATGFNVEEARAFADFKGDSVDFGTPITPRPFPLQALDHSAAYLLAFGVTAALCKTVTEGGSWEVRVSLASVGNWVRSLGRLGPDGFKNTLPRSLSSSMEIAGLSTKLRIANPGSDTQGNCEIDVDVSSPPQSMTMSALRHAAILEKTPVVVKDAPVRLDVDLPCWLARS